MLRRLLAIILCLLPLAAEAQPVEEPWFWFFMPGRGNIKRAYHLDRSGTAQGGLTKRVSFDAAVAATYTPEVGTGTFTVNDAPVRATDGTWPAGFGGTQGYGWWFDGTNDYLSSAIAPPAGSFSAYVVFTPRRAGTLEYIVGNWVQTTPIRGQMIYISASGAVNWISSADGAVAQATITCASTWVLPGRPIWVGIKLDCSAGAGACVASCRADELAAVTSSGLNPIFSGAAGLSFAAGNAGANPFRGIIHEWELADGEIWSEDDFKARRRAWWGVISSDGHAGTSVDATDSAAGLPAIQVCPAGTCEPHWVTSPRDTARVGSYAAGKGGLTTYRARTNYVRNPTFSSCTATGGTEPDLWTVTETAGDGSADVYCDATTYAHALTSTALYTTGTTSVAQIDQRAYCRAELAGGTAHLRTHARKSSGTAELFVGLRTFTDAGCTLGAANSWLATASGIDLSATWAELEGEIDLSAVGSWYPIIVQSGAALAFVDGVEVTDFDRGDVPHTSACLDCTTDAACACTALLSKIRWPLCTEFEYRTTMSTPYAVGDLVAMSQNHYVGPLVYGLGGTVDNSTSIQLDTSVRQAMRCTVHEAGLNLRWNYADPSLWDAYTEYTVGCGHRQTGNAGLGTVLYSQDGVVYNNEGSSGTGSSLMDACGDTYGRLGNDTTYGNDGWTKHVILFRAPVSWWH